MEAELTEAVHDRIDVVVTGEPCLVRTSVRFLRNVDEPIVGFLIRNRHGIHAYGTNTKEQQLDLGKIQRGTTLEFSFAFNCWLGVDQYSISLAVHSREGQAYDWVDGALFFRVTSLRVTEGVANLNASASVRHHEDHLATTTQENTEAKSRLESMSHA